MATIQEQDKCISDLQDYYIVPIKIQFTASDNRIFSGFNYIFRILIGFNIRVSHISNFTIPVFYERERSGVYNMILWKTRQFSKNDILLSDDWYSYDTQNTTSIQYKKFNNDIIPTLILQSNTWIISIPLEQYEKYLIPSKIYCPIFEKNFPNPIPCNCIAMFTDYKFINYTPISKNFGLKTKYVHQYQSIPQKYRFFFEGEQKKVNLLMSYHKLILAKLLYIDDRTEYIGDVLTKILSYIKTDSPFFENTTRHMIIDRICIEYGKKKQTRKEDNIKLKLIKNRKYKSKICRKWAYGHVCNNGDVSKCNFAHGINDLVGVDVSRLSTNPKYKTIMCRNWTESNYCSFGTRCDYSHGECDKR